jgi:hypothetical protein
MTSHLTRVLTVVLFSILAAAAEASVETKPVGRQSPSDLSDPLADCQVVPSDSAGIDNSVVSRCLGMAPPITDLCVGCVELGSRGPVGFSNLAEIAGLQRYSLPEPATLAVWSLIGLCWSGVNVWRRRRSFDRGSNDLSHRGGIRRVNRRPWPDHVRAQILEIVEGRSVR